MTKSESEIKIKQRWNKSIHKMIKMTKAHMAKFQKLIFFKWKPKI